VGRRDQKNWFKSRVKMSQSQTIEAWPEVFMAGL